MEFLRMTGTKLIALGVRILLCKYRISIKSDSDLLWFKNSSRLIKHKPCYRVEYYIYQQLSSNISISNRNSKVDIETKS